MTLCRVLMANFVAGAVVETESGMIRYAAPILGRFIGQDVSRLTRWVWSKGALWRSFVPARGCHVKMCQNRVKALSNTRLSCLDSPC